MEHAMLSIHGTFRQYGKHCWPGHDTLGTPHMHTFEFIWEIEEVEGGRSIDFLTFNMSIKSRLLQTFPHVEGYNFTKIYDFGMLSCESLAIAAAREIKRYIEEFELNLARTVRVTVNEKEEECGATFEIFLPNLS